jgi:putative transposon-encoded protein
MPASPPFAQFDETGVVFHRVPRPIGASAKLAIERFVLVR